MLFWINDPIIITIRITYYYINYISIIALPGSIACHHARRLMDAMCGRTAQEACAAQGQGGSRPPCMAQREGSRAGIEPIISSAGDLQISLE